MALTSLTGQTDLPRWFETYFSIMQRADAGTLETALPDGRVFVIKGSKPGPTGRIDAVSREFFTRLARDGELGFSEMYMEG